MIRKKKEDRTVSYNSLSPRQKEIAILISQGLTVNEISEQLGITKHTIKTHVSAIRVILKISKDVTIRQYFGDKR